MVRVKIGSVSVELEPKIQFVENNVKQVQLTSFEQPYSKHLLRAKIDYTRKSWYWTEIN